MKKKKKKKKKKIIIKLFFAITIRRTRTFYTYKKPKTDIYTLISKLRITKKVKNKTQTKKNNLKNNLKNKNNPNKFHNPQFYTRKY